MGNLSDRCQCCGETLPPERSYRCKDCTEYHYCKIEYTVGKCWEHCGCRFPVVYSKPGEQEGLLDAYFESGPEVEEEEWPDVISE